MEDTRRRSTTHLAHLTPLRVRMLPRRQMAGRDHTFKCWVSLAYGGWVATALHSDSLVAGEIEMKVLFLSFIVGLGVGALYGLIRVKSPAPPIVALLGLLGMVLGEQFGTWIHTKKLDVSRAASVCLVGERYDRPLYNSPSHETRYDPSSIFAKHISMTDEVDTTDVHSR
jgi:XapX domain-containing protein